MGLYQRAAENGDTEAMKVVADMMSKEGREKEALIWYQQAAESGDVDMVFQTLEVMLRAGYGVEANQWAISIFDLFGDKDITRLIAEITNRVCQSRSAAEAMIPICLQFAETGDIWAIKAAALLLCSLGRTAEAITWYEHAAETGDIDSIRFVADLLRKMDAETTRSNGTRC